MKILYIKLVNFIGVHAARGLREVEYDFSKIDKPIIQLHGPNRCGKTVLIQQLHPFSSINLNGDDRSDLSLIIPGEHGLKNIVYEFNGDVYDITHTYKPNSSGTNHTVSSSIKKNGEELNSAGGVNVFNTLINNLFGINKYTFQFIINGTQLTSFASMSTVQRKNLLNKAMGIDIYDKIHKMSTEDYRYTNKLITSLNNTKEFVLSTYGSYDNLKVYLENKQKKHDELSSSIQEMRSRMDILNGQISVLRGENIQYELSESERLLDMFESVRNEIGSFDDSVYDKLVDQQIQLNADISEAKNKRIMLTQDIDNLYAKKNDIENTLRNNKRIKEDYDNMLITRQNINNQIMNLIVEIDTEAPASYYASMLTTANLINNICKEIALSINPKKLKLLTDMIIKDIDVAAFIIQEGSLLMDSEKEKTVMSRIQSMINTIDGDWNDDCPKLDRCIYWRTYDTLSKYFKAAQSSNEAKFTQYDMEQFDHAYKNVLSIKKLISQTSLNEDVEEFFNIKRIMSNVNDGNLGIMLKPLQILMESATNLETKKRLIQQLNDVDSKIKMMEEIIVSDTDVESAIQDINNKINQKSKEIENVKTLLDSLVNSLSDNDRKRLLLSQIKHIKYDELKMKRQKYLDLSISLNNAEMEYDKLSQEYNSSKAEFGVIENDLKKLTDAYNQYNKTVDDIATFSNEDNMYRIIAEATSSTKGKPVLAIREEIEHALSMSNRLLDVIYDGEVELLSPTIDENNFSLPFRSASHTGPDIKHGSQSESCLLSLAISLSLASSLTIDMVPLIDECDAFIDEAMKGSFVLMLQEMMTTLGVEQMFLISHNAHAGQYDHIVHVLDITED